MSNPTGDDKLAGDEKLDPAQAQLVRRVRWLMAISGLATVLGIAVVLVVIGYRVFRSEGSAGSTNAAADVTALVPKGARVVQTAVAGDRIAVTVEAGSSTEILTFDLKTLKQTGRLRFATEP